MAGFDGLADHSRSALAQVIPWGHSKRVAVSGDRLHLRFEASPWRNWAISRTRRRACEKPRVSLERGRGPREVRCPLRLNGGPRDVPRVTSTFIARRL